MSIDQTQCKPGMAGESVTKLHRRLGLLGLEVPAEERNEDRFGPGTEAAIRQFQATNGLPVVGVLDDATARGLGLGGYPRSITGLVCKPDGSPLGGVAVGLYQHGPGGERLVAETRSGPEGMYSLPWPHGFSGGLTVLADGAAKKSLSWKTVQASGTAWVRLSVGGEFRGASRFAMLTSALAPAVEGEAFHAVGGQGRAREIKAVAEAASVPHHDVSRHVLAHKLAARTRIDAAVYFALVQRVAPDPTVGDAQALDDAYVEHALDAVLRMRPEDLRAALQTAVRDNIVASLDIEAAARALHALQIDHLAAQPLTWSIAHAMSDEHACCAAAAEGIPTTDEVDPDEPSHAEVRPLQVDSAPLRDVLATSVADPAIQRQVIEALAAHDRGAQLGAVADSVVGLSPDQRAHLRFTLEAAALLGNHLPLVQRVQKLFASKAITRTADLARFDEADWARLLHEADPSAQRIALPARSKLAAAPASDRIDHVARLLARRFERSHPTVALAGRLAKDEGELRLAQAKGAQRFLDRAPLFCIRHTHVDRFVQEAGAAALPAGDDHAQVVADLKTLQRGYKLTSRFDHVRAMLAAGHTSAQSIHAIGPERFAAQLAAAGATLDEASAMFAAAQQVHATAMTLLGNFHSAFTSATPAAVAQPVSAELIQSLVSLPAVQSLFGNTDYCACAECRAIHGPAAYLVDILQFLRARIATGGPANALAVLSGRRPDIPQLQLSCDNTNGLVPYIDLVCEMLEDAMGTAPTAAELQRVTTGTPEEVRANPAFVRDGAYSVLGRAQFPIATSFDLDGAETRAFLGQLGVRRHELMAAWQAGGSPADAEIAAERFGLNLNALGIITTATPPLPWLLWNLGQNNQGSRVPPGLGRNGSMFA